MYAETVTEAKRDTLTASVYIGALLSDHEKGKCASFKYYLSDNRLLRLR